MFGVYGLTCRYICTISWLDSVGVVWGSISFRANSR